MEFYVAGYYLIQGSNKKNWMDKDKLLPDKIWSGSRHICPKIPDGWIFAWVADTESKEEKKYARTQFLVSDEEFINIQKEYDDLLASGQYGFPNVYMNKEIVIDQYYKYFRVVPNLKILGFAMPESYYTDFIEEYQESQYLNQNGVYLKLIQKEICKYSAIGFDLLGWDGADYCSFLCGSMESEIHEKYGVQYNSLGLISEFEQAENVSQAIHHGKEMVEDGFWCPWLVFEVTSQ